MKHKGQSPGRVRHPARASLQLLELHRSRGFNADRQRPILTAMTRRPWSYPPIKTRIPRGRARFEPAVRARNKGIEPGWVER